ncbi:MAG: TIGR00282 family metallophosphoesterase [Brevinema sp.]
MQKFPQKHKNNIRLAIFGDLVGAAGRATAKILFPIAKQEWGADIVIANGENTSHGYGLTPKHAQELRSYGVDILTMGNHTWDKHILRHTIKKYPFIARPINQVPETPGVGYTVIETAMGKLAVINAVGRQCMSPAECPFHAVFNCIKQLKKEGIRMIALDFHAEVTAEKQIMGRFLDGRASLVWGTHTHVQTSDDTIHPAGTGYISDIGMTGAANSIIGFEIDPALKKMIYNEPHRLHPETKGELSACGIIADLNPHTGKCAFIMRFREKLPAVEGLVEENAEREKAQEIQVSDDSE